MKRRKMFACFISVALLRTAEALGVANETPTIVQNNELISSPRCYKLFRRWNGSIRELAWFCEGKMVSPVYRSDDEAFEFRLGGESVEGFGESFYYPH